MSISNAPLISMFNLWKITRLKPITPQKKPITNCAINAAHFKLKLGIFMNKKQEQRARLHKAKAQFHTEQLNALYRTATA